MKTYKWVNNVTGWLIFAIAAFTYCSTIEPTASFWDCPEFISTAVKQEVGHPPGAPFFMLFGKLFSVFAGDATQYAKMINIMSALLSAGCILLLFWSITHLARKLMVRDDETEIGGGKLTAIMASGVCGALIYTWSDTFWFSAVEGEVYAFSSFFTALVFWLILKWEDNADRPHSDRWLVLIAYLVGLSIGVHLLNLLCIPAIVLVYYYKKSKEPTLKGSLAVLGVSVVIVAAVLYGIVPGIVKIGGWFELLFVNVFGMPFNSGLYVYLVLLVGTLVASLVMTQRAKNKPAMIGLFIASTILLGIPFYGHGWGSVIIGVIVVAALVLLLLNSKKVTARLLNTTLLCMTLMAIGYASYAVIVIRSTANPPMDQNSPEDVFSLGIYLGREQYGDRPLFWGPTYASQPEIVEDGEGNLVYNMEDGDPIYQRHEKINPDEPDRYEIVGYKKEYVYPSNQCMLFPRIYYSMPPYPELYKQWIGDPNTHSVQVKIPGHYDEFVDIPSQADNMRYFFSYQIGFMYFRYFMWNFAGRQNDIQSQGEAEHGNWITGFSAFDNWMLGDQSLLPSELQNNKGHNVFYCMPLLLGLLGLFWQAYRGKRGIQQFWVVFFLFFMTGLAIVVYLNQLPRQPRERDYAYAGSFYAYAIWCGLGIAAIYQWLKTMLQNRLAKRTASILAATIAVIPALAVPLQMVSQTWDDHDRSDRYFCRDFGLNYLETIPHDGVIYTNGDNDTFPLWYNEDVEGNRTDVRVCNLSYLNTDWYIDQMLRPAFEGEGASSPLPISWKRYEYVEGQHTDTYVNPPVNNWYDEYSAPRTKEYVQAFYELYPEEAKAIWGEEPFELNNAIDKFVLNHGTADKISQLPEDLRDMAERVPQGCLPSDTLYLNVDKEAVRKSGMQIPNDSIPDRMYISLAGKSRVYKNFIMMLDMIGQSNFSRPLYMSTTVGAENYGELYKHFIQEGMAWRITPFTYEQNRVQTTVVDTDKMYDNMMNKFRYGNLSQPGLYIDETSMRMCYTHRKWFALLAEALVKEGKMQKAIEVLDRCEKEIPSYNVPHCFESGSFFLAEYYIEGGKYQKAVAILEDLEKRSAEYATWYNQLSDNRFAAVLFDNTQHIKILASIAQMYDDMSKADKKHGKEMEKRLKRVNDTLTPLYQTFANRCNALGLDPLGY
ncbi:MAG: DUF2723 domain-containing protein [Prevotellaceae bacterium]|nr:DUF2723 domain-containing protein [Prevotellaceae bacterium]